jgi:hypothetical protein
MLILVNQFLNENQKQELVNLINKNSNVFAKHALDVGCVKWNRPKTCNKTCTKYAGY